MVSEIQLIGRIFKMSIKTKFQDTSTLLRIGIILNHIDNKLNSCLHLYREPTPNSPDTSSDRLQRLYLMHFLSRCTPLFFIAFPLLKSFTSPILSDPNLHLQSNSSPKFKQGTKRYFTAKKRRGVEKKKVWIKRQGNGIHCTNVGGISMSAEAQ